MNLEAMPDWGPAIDALRDAEEICIACHFNPDGDALGSLLGASLGLRSLGKRTFPSFGNSPAKIPFGYDFLPGADSLLQPSELLGGGLLLALDCGVVRRLGALEPLAATSATTINVDHHPGNDNFGKLNIVATDASSTAEIVTRMLQALGVKLDVKMATCLYTGINTDTGSFQYSNSSPDTLRLAADLLALGVDAPFISQQVHESSPFGFLKLVGRVLDRAVLHEEQRFIYSYYKRKDLIETGVAPDETDKLLDMIRSTRAADVAGLFKEQSDGKYRVSLRSKGSVSVGAIARKRGGGGHELAAGFTADDVENTVLAMLPELGAS